MLGKTEVGRNTNLNSSTSASSREPIRGLVRPSVGDLVRDGDDLREGEGLRLLAVFDR